MTGRTGPARSSRRPVRPVPSDGILLLHMSAPLPRVWSLITDSWNAFVKHWDVTVRYSAWFIPATLLQIAPLLISQFSNPVFKVIAILAPLAGLLVMVWASLSLYLAILALEKGEKVTDKTTAAAWALLPALLWIGIMQGVTTLGALILLIIPGIYVGVRLSFSQFGLMDKGLRGRDALAASWALTKNRFWAIFGRQLAGGALFVLFTVIVMAIATMIVELVAGRGLVAALSDPNNPLSSAVPSFISSIVEAALVPAIAVFQVKLYRALEKTK